MEYRKGRNFLKIDLTDKFITWDKLESICKRDLKNLNTFIFNLHTILVGGGTFLIFLFYWIGIRGSERLELLSDGEGNGNPLQYSCLENPMDGGA